MLSKTRPRHLLNAIVIELDEIILATEALNNKMGKTRDLFRKIGGIKGRFHARMATIKDRNSKDLIEAEGIKKRWQEYTELYKKRSS